MNNGNRLLHAKIFLFGIFPRARNFPLNPSHRILCRMKSIMKHRQHISFDVL